MATVLLAEDPLLKRRVALKVIKEELGTQNPWVERFKTEAATIASIRHLNIVEIFDFGVEEGKHYFVMEYVDGPSLQALTRMNEAELLPADLVAALMAQAADGLRAAHESSVVHRDIKPDNLMVNASGILKIADFGLARILSEPSLTRTGDTLGSPGFMSPEQVRGEKLSPESDLFSLGGVFYFCLTGKLPFEGPNIHATMWKICDSPHQPVQEILPDCNPELANIIDTLLEKDPSKRGAGAQELSLALKRYLGRRGVGDIYEFTRKYFAILAWPVVISELPAKRGAPIESPNNPAQFLMSVTSEIVRPVDRKKGNYLLSAPWRTFPLWSWWMMAGLLAGIFLLFLLDRRESRNGKVSFEPSGGRPIQFDAKTRTEYHSGTGKMVVRYADGRIESECFEPKGIPDGPCKSWYPNGHMKVESHWKAGKKQGRYMEWDASGRALVEGFYQNGEMHGTWTFWDGDGTSRRVQYKQGQPSLKK